MPAPRDLRAARRLLRRHWGHAGLRPAQRPVVRATLEGRDVLAVLPTGAGKSLCYQLPALLVDGLTLVVSPLISLMEDQVDGARRRGLPAAALTSSLSRRGRRGVGRRVREGAVRLLYVAPERLDDAALDRLLEDVPLARVAVDEAHCVSEWGHEFRPAYRRIGDFLGEVEARRGVRPPVAALTATATPATRRDVTASLGLRRPATVTAPVDRPNLLWAARRVRRPGAALEVVAGAVRGAAGAAIVYTATRRRAVAAARRLRRLGIGARPYHAGLPGGARSRVQAGFLDGRHRVVCATRAFGMGIDHPGVRVVCHLGIPGSLEAYVQEAGRAGRDGEPARCLLVSHADDAGLQARLASRSWPPARLLEGVWRAMPPGRPLTAAEVARRTGGGWRTLSGRTSDPARVAAALRLLRQFGCVRTAEGGEERLWIRAPEPLRRRIDFGAPRRGRRRAARRLEAVRGYLRSRRCRRATIAAYFGEEPPVCAGCDRCGNSRRPPRDCATSSRVTSP